MKRYIKLKIAILSILMVTLCSSCLKKDLPELPLWDTNEITAVNPSYRFLNSARVRNGEPVVESQPITTADVVIDKTNATISLRLIVPGPNTAINFTAAEKAKVVQTNLWFSLNISTAASVQPVEGTAKLGFPTDATKPLKYIVTAANGASRTWTINITSFTNQ